MLANLGKAIEAYERKINPGPARFDRYAQAVLTGHLGRAKTIYDGDQVAGLRLFIGAAGCIACHNGPLLTNHAFENFVNCYSFASKYSIITRFYKFKNFKWNYENVLIY